MLIHQTTVCVGGQEDVTFEVGVAARWTSSSNTARAGDPVELIALATVEALLLDATLEHLRRDVE